MYGGGGSGYHGGGGTTDPGGNTGGAGGGSGYSNPTYVPTPSLEYEAAVGSHSLPSPNSIFDEAPYYTALPAPRQALFADGARGEGSASGTTNIGGDGGILLVFDAGAQATSMTLVSDTFTASTTPSTARIVVFAELPDGLSDFTVSATRDNTNYDTIVFDPISLTQNIQYSFFRTNYNLINTYYGAQVWEVWALKSYMKRLNSNKTLLIVT